MPVFYPYDSCNLPAVSIVVYLCLKVSKGAITPGLAADTLLQLFVSSIQKTKPTETEPATTVNTDFYQEH